MCNQLKNNFKACLLIYLSLTLTACSPTYPEYIDTIKDIKAELTYINGKVGVSPTDKMNNSFKYTPMILDVYFEYKVKDVRSFTQSVKSAALELGYFMPNVEQLNRESKSILFLCSKKSKDRYLVVYESERDSYYVNLMQDGNRMCY